MTTLKYFSRLLLALALQFNFAHTFAQKLSVNGFLQPSGLKNDTASKRLYSIKTGDFLLMNGVTQYILETKMDLNPFRGQYCEVSGSVRTKSIKGCSVLTLDEIKITAFRGRFDHRESLVEKKEKLYRKKKLIGELDTLSGVVIRYTRPSPDILLDYAILRDGPFLLGQTSDTTHLQKAIPISYLDFGMMKDYETLVRSKKKIRIIGYLRKDYGQRPSVDVLQIE